MPILSQLVLYPIKSCAGVELAEAVLTEAGLAARGLHDREWMVVNEDGQFLTQREHPRMALVVPRFAGRLLVLDAPGMAPFTLDPSQREAPGSRQVRLWEDSLPADDCGAAAAAWFSRALATRCRLVRFRPGVKRVASAKWTAGIEAPTRFADGYPLLVIGAASLADLNARLAAAGRAALPMNRFRPNLVIDGSEAYEEDYVEAFDFGAATLKPVKPCPRCPIPSVDQATGIPGPDPLDLLQTYRAKPQLDGAPCFGMNCIVTEGAGTRLAVGQQLEARLAFECHGG